jgi:Rrf2 family transcriptional regulator, repressor of oqxAB
LRDIEINCKGGGIIVGINSSIKIGPPRFGIAVHALIWLAQSGGALSSVVIAKKVNSHATFLRRVLIQLAQAGIVEAREGRDGGYSLLRDPNHITLADIFLAVDDSACVEQEMNIDCGIEGKKRGTRMEACCESETQAGCGTYAKELEMRLLSIKEEIQKQTIMLLNQHTLAEVMKDIDFT